MMDDESLTFDLKQLRRDVLCLQMALYSSKDRKKQDASVVMRAVHDLLCTVSKDLGVKK